MSKNVSANDITHRLDFDADGKSDFAVYRQSDGTWYVLQSSNNTLTSRAVGIAGDSLIPADYDGDQKSDRAVFRPHEKDDYNVWIVWQSSDPENPFYQPYGLLDDAKFPRDYDGDGKSDLTSVRIIGGQFTWYIWQSSTDTVRVVQFGITNDCLVAADYDGDAQSDVAVYRPSNKTYYILRSSNNQVQSQVLDVGLGTVYPPMPAEDYDGDGKADFVNIFLVSGNTLSWYILQSSNGVTRFESWGNDNDDVVSGDYDGDGKHDVAVWRRTTRIWYVLQSSTGTLKAETFGQFGDVAIPTVKLGAFFPH